jgi:IS30 family transposase
MTKSPKKLYTHLTLEDRKEIQECLDKNMTFKAIASRVRKDQRTISREVKNRLQVQPLSVRRTKADGTPIEETPCPELLKAPFVCNPCKQRRRNCPFQKQLYLADNAHEGYATLLKEAREGIPLTKEEFWEADGIIAEKIEQGQHLYHILESNDIPFSKSSAYRYVNNGYLSISKIDLPRAAKFKARKKRNPDFIPKSIKKGRSYADFRTYLTEHALTSWVEMDTVIGRVGGKVIMTFDFTSCNFMFGLLLDNKTAAEAALKIKELKRRLAGHPMRFGDIIPILLTDNGGEFANISAFMNNLDEEKETELFFCDPYQSSQKPHVEKNHTIFRDICPKSSSFDEFTQETVDLIFSHVNGVKRKALNGKSPYEMFSFLYSSEIALLFGISEIPAGDVIQSSKLLSNSKK